MSSTTQTKQAPVSAVIRELTFQDGSSNKFWTISLDGSSHTVRFGRVGTQGQTQTKEFADADEARKSFDKLVAEKLKKGYFDAAGNDKSTPTAAPSKPARAGKKTTAEPAATYAPDVVQAAAKQADVAMTRSIDLSPLDWMRATFRPRQILPRPEALPFDLERCVAALAKLRRDDDAGVRWSDLPLSYDMSREEAHFWFMAIRRGVASDGPLKTVAAKLGDQTYNGQLSLAQAATSIGKILYDVPHELIVPLIRLFRPNELLELADSLMKASRVQSDAISSLLTQGFRAFVVPYLTDEELAPFRQAVRAVFDPTRSPKDVWNPLPADYYLAAALGMHDEVYAITATWADDRFTSQYKGGKGMYRAGADETERPQDILFGLGSAALIESEWRRLKLRMRSPENARGFLACTEFAALDCLRDSILEITDKEPCQEMLEVLALVHAPEAAEPMLACMLGCKASALARKWLEQNLGCAITGLVGTAAGRGKLADAALEFLQDAKRKGYESLIAKAAHAANGTADAGPAGRVAREVIDHEEKTYEPLDEATMPDWLRQVIADAAGTKKRKLASWASPAVLPPLVVGERRLTDEQMDVVLNALAATPVATRHPLLTALREHIGAPFRDAFAWKLFQSWLAEGAPSKEKWAMGAIGHLGGDDCALKLTPLVRTWPGESQHQRAVFGLECLRAIGSDAALMQLAGVAQKLKFKGLKAKAEQFVNEIAAERGMTRAELEDRVVPDCGLDENGRREFSFGTRTFSFVLGGDLKPMIRDADGKLRGDLPKSGAKDDAAIAAQSVAEWKLLKKQIRDVAQLQAGRLEQAMVTGRRWKTADFTALLVRHPLLTHLVRQLVWGDFDEHGRRTATFRVTEERDYADVADNAVSLDKAATVAIVHPLELGPDERAAWGDVLSDYEIVPPFAQLGRAVFALEPGEEHEQDLKRFHGLKLVAPTLVFTLEKLGWSRGVAMDGGCFDEHSKQYPAAGVTAVVGYQGTVSMGYIDPNEMLTIDSVHFVTGMRPPSGYGWNSKQKRKLGKVPPVVISEVLADVQLLKSKSK